MTTAVEVTYTNFKVKEGVDAGDIKKLMCRDASWGTHIDILHAAQKTCGETSHKKWQSTEPLITNCDSGRADDARFCLTFPKDNFDFETESIDHFISVVAGDIVLNPSVDSIEVHDFNFIDQALYVCFPGPNVGISRLYSEFMDSTLSGDRRPLVAFTVKPRFGMSASEIGKVYAEAAESEIDIVEDDERLIDPVSCRFSDRVKVVSRIQKDYKTIYSVNITSDSEDALRKLDFCADHGIRMVKLDVLVSGFETLRKVAQRIKERYQSNIAITVYPDAYGAYRRLSRDFILKMSRLCGADIIYAGSPNWARYEKEHGTLKETIEPIYQRHLLLAEAFAGGDHIKSTLPTITNDQHLSRSELITTYFRKHKKGHYEYAFFVGGGISGFPADIRTSVREWMQCIEHASSEKLEGYVPYDLSKYEKELERNGWFPLDIAEALR